jgi:hypothetical protein
MGLDDRSRWGRCPVQPAATLRAHKRESACTRARTGALSNRNESADTQRWAGFRLGDEVIGYALNRIIAGRTDC